MVAALVIPWRQVLALVVQATIVNNRFIYIYMSNKLFTIYLPHDDGMTSATATQLKSGRHNVIWHILQEYVSHKREIDQRKTTL